MPRKRKQEKVTTVVVVNNKPVNRLVEPLSEHAIFQWLPKTALPELLGVPRGHLSLNALYRCLSAVAPHKAAIEEHLVRQGRDLFGFTNDLLLYDLTSTYFEGRMANNPKAQRRRLANRASPAPLHEGENSKGSPAEVNPSPVSFHPFHHTPRKRNEMKRMERLGTK